MKSPAEGLPLVRTVAPTGAADLVAVVREAYRDRVPLYPIGGGTSLDFGAMPKRRGLGVSMRGLSEVVDFPARDLTVTAQAGASISSLAAQLASQGLRLPVDIPQPDRATLGGVVACNPSGPRRYGWGTMRDYVIGFTAVDGSGTPFSAGGRVVKNAAGYDLCRLVTGSLGTLGIITQVTLMVKPIPQANALVAATLADTMAAERLLAGMVKSSVLPAAVELLTGPFWSEALPAGEDNTANRFWVVVGLEGTTTEVDWMLDELDRQWRRSEGIMARTFVGGEADRLWNRLTEFPAVDDDPIGQRPLVVRVGVLPSQVAALVRQLTTIDPGCSIQAHAGTGVIRARLSWPPEQVAAGLEDRLRPAVKAASGHLVVLACPASAGLTCEAAWGSSLGGATIMRSIKEKFDPANILNPGRFVFSDL